VSSAKHDKEEIKRDERINKKLYFIWLKIEPQIYKGLMYENLLIKRIDQKRIALFFTK
jgi:hypothetical protein